MKTTFDSIILIGRPAAGKSEVIDYLKKANPDERKTRFHIGSFQEFDDFPYVWQTFENDDIYSKHGKERLNTDKDYFFRDSFIWNFYIERICLDYRKVLARDPSFHEKNTAVFEFSRGGENGFGEAFSYLSDEVLKRSGIVYISVSYEESLRKNRKRFRPELKDSILYHSLPDEKMEFYYKINDWEKLSGGNPTGFIQIKEHKVPFSVFYNEPEVTDKPEELGQALDNVFMKLWEIYPK
jgi:hypothetical protein